MTIASEEGQRRAKANLQRGVVKTNFFTMESQKGDVAGVYTPFYRIHEHFRKTTGVE